MPAIGGGVQHVLKEAAVPFAYMAFGRAGMQFFLMDRDGAGGQEPLLLRLTRDHPVEVGPPEVDHVCSYVMDSCGGGMPLNGMQLVWETTAAEADLMARQ